MRPARQDYPSLAHQAAYTVILNEVDMLRGLNESLKVQLEREKATNLRATERVRDETNLNADLFKQLQMAKDRLKDLAGALRNVLPVIECPEDGCFVKTTNGWVWVKPEGALSEVDNSDESL